MASIVSVEQIKGLAGGSTPNTITIPSGQTLHAPGHVIQVVSQVWTTENIANVAADYPVASGVKLSITPKLATSKILVTANLDCWLDAPSNRNIIGKYGIRLNSQNNALVAEKRFSALLEATVFSSMDLGGEVTLQYLADPNSTSPQEYEVVLGRWSSTYANNVKINGGGFGHSSMTLMEIAQ